MTENDEKASSTPSRNRAVLTKQRLILLGALIGSTCALLSSAGFLGGLGIIFPTPYMLIVMAVGALFGISVIFLAGNHDGARWVALAIAAFIGLVVPFCLIQILFLLAGPGDL